MTDLEGRSAPDAYGVAIHLVLLAVSCWSVARWLSTGAVSFVSGWIFCAGAVWALAAIGDAILRWLRSARRAGRV